MGDHHRNPLSQARQRGEQIVQVVKLGESGFALTGFGFQPTQDAEGNLAVVVTAIGGRVSDIAGFMPVMGLVLATLGKVSVSELVEKLTAQETAAKESAPETP